MALKKNEAAELAKAEAALDAEAKAAAVKEETTPEPEGKETPAQALVKVVNLTHSTLYQHSSGLFIGPKAEKALLNDGWLANQLKARLLKRV